MVRGNKVTKKALFEEAMKVANDAWNIQPVRAVRMPVLENKQTVKTALVDALWTDGGLRPNASNLAFLMQDIDLDELEQWKKRLQTLPVRASLLVSPENLYLIQPSSDNSGNLEQQQLDIDGWRQTLVSPKPHLFKPKELAKLRTGQLSLADLEEEISERSLTFLLRQQTQVDNAFQQAIDAAFKKVPKGSVSSRAEIKGHIIRFSIAYLAARILQDKNFFGSGEKIQVEDPITLLDRMVSLTNGFFRRARESAQYVNEQIRQELANSMGYRVSFVLTDHRDVGRLYERAIKQLPAPKELDSEEWGDLNRHYTPVKIAERMLEALPLERLRPEKRFIFDPAAGSGSLLLAATSRLANMTDIPSGEERQAYLKTHVVGNDKDEYAKLIAQLRYFLASESLARANDIAKITDILPFPSDENLTCKDYEILNINDLPVKPKVIVANPPFQEKGKNQKAARFVEKALEWLDEGSQFAFILPQSFLTATTHGIPKARNLLAERCQILEVWQFPEGVIGTDARQSTCVLVGIVGKSNLKPLATVSRAIFSGSKIDEIREQGFLGKSWIASSDPRVFSEVTTPPIKISVSTVKLGGSFYTFSGVNPGSLARIYPPIKEPNPEVKCKKYWRLSWKGENRLWANPNNVPNDKQWIRYGSEYLEGSRLQQEALFDFSKILVGRKVNRNSSEPLVVRLDTTGFCPNNDVYCVFPVAQVNRYNRGYEQEKKPDNLLNFTVEEQRLWLIGLLSSDLLNALSLIGRNAREMVKELFLDLPIPTKVDDRIIEIMKEIVRKEKESDDFKEILGLRHELNELVEESYGKPKWYTPQRTGELSEFEDWKIERKLETKTIIGEVLYFSEDRNQVYIYISRLMDDDDAKGEWIPLPQELPGWALDGTPFEAELSHDVKTFDQLKERPWALRHFRHTPRPYLTDDELGEFLRMPEEEVL